MLPPLAAFGKYGALGGRDGSKVRALGVGEGDEAPEGTSAFNRRCYPFNNQNK